MNIAVIAANGRLGKAFVQRALKDGHTVRAGIRGKDDFDPHPNLTKIDCDATKASDLKRLLKGQDAVVSCIGHVKGSAPDVQTLATKTLVRVMNGLGMKRFVTVTGTGVRFPGDKVSIVDRILNFAVTRIDPDRVHDGRHHMDVLLHSDLDWTVIRILKLQNVAARGFALRLHGPTKWYVGRTEVAAAMLQVLVDGSFIQQAPIISKK